MPSVDPTPSGRSRDELFAHVMRRGQVLRRRRQALQGLGGAALVLVLALVAGQVAGAGDDEQIVADRPAITTTTASVPPVETTTTAPSDTTPPTEPPTTVTVPPTTVPPPTTTTVAGGGAGAGGSAADSLDPLMGRAYRGTDVTESGQPRPLVEDTEITIAFERNASSGEDVVRWSAGCNTSGGSVVSVGGRLHVTDGGSTQIGCTDERHDQDQWLAEFLLGKPAWQLDGSTLVLTLDDTVITIEEQP